MTDDVMDDVSVTVIDPDHEIAEWLKDRYFNDLLILAQLYPEVRSLYLNYDDIAEIQSEYGLDYGRMVRQQPEKFFGYVRGGLAELTTTGYRDGSEVEPMIPVDDGFAKIHVRVINLPSDLRTTLRSISTDHIGQFIAVEGMLRKVSERMPFADHVAYKCAANGCNKIHMVETEYGMTTQPPRECSWCGAKGRFKIDPKQCVYIDLQRARIQEMPESLRGGETPVNLDLDIRDDLTCDDNSLQPGTRLVVNGILRAVPSEKRESAVFYRYLEVNSFEVMDANYEEIEISQQDIDEIRAIAADPRVYDRLIHSVAPSIYGYRAIKEAMVMILFGGVRKEFPGNTTRGDSHCLLVGDPGVAKSQLIHFMTKMSPRGIFTSGKSSTTAGLTCTAVKDDISGSWSIDAGALVLADGGICGVDEMDKMGPETRSSLHEAMEQQRVSVAKAGIVTSLRCQCSIVGAANPKDSRFDPYLPIAEQINMEASLLSRFDLIFTIQDQVDDTMDGMIAEHITNTHLAGEMKARFDRGHVVDVALMESMLDAAEPAIPIDMVRKYVAYARRECFPVMTEEARELFMQFYTSMRSLGKGTNKPIPVTARSLEALVRLGEASARIRLSDVVDRSDAERVLAVVGESLKQTLYDQKTGQYDAGRRDGLSKSTYDRLKTVRDAVKKVSGGNQCKRGELIATLMEMGISNVEAEKTIEQVLRSGMALEPRHGLIKLME